MGGSVTDTLDTGDLNAFLAHFGVKGMKWGVRRKSTRLPATGDSKAAQKVVTKAKVNSTDALSNKELRTAIERLNLEQQYSRLRPKTGSEKVKTWIADQLLGIGKEQASKIGRDFAAEQVKSALKKS